MLPRLWRGWSTLLRDGSGSAFRAGALQPGHSRPRRAQRRDPDRQTRQPPVQIRQMIGPGPSDKTSCRRPSRRDTLVCWDLRMFRSGGPEFFWPVLAGEPVCRFCSLFSSPVTCNKLPGTTTKSNIVGEFLAGFAFIGHNLAQLLGRTVICETEQPLLISLPDTLPVTLTW